MATMTVGKLAKTTGINIETVRFYEREGLMPKPERTSGGHRLFDDSDVARLRFIQHCKDVGFTLKEIHDLLFLRDSEIATCEDVCELAKRKVGEIDRKIAMLSEMRDHLKALTEVCHNDQRSTDCCAIIKGLEDGENPRIYAEYCAVPSPQCLPLPRGFDMLQAAALPENYFTVWHNLFERGQLKAGEKVLIHGGASGIGTTAIQLAKAFGATVFTTVRTAAKAKAVTELGADHAIIYKDNDWAAEVKKLSGGVDVVLDMVAGEYLPKNLGLLKLDGRCVVIAVQLGATATISAGIVMVNRLTLTGSTLRPQSVENKGRMARGLKEKVWPLLEAGKIKPIIFKTFPLRQAAEAHAELERADHVGKVMMTV